MGESMMFLWRVKGKPAPKAVANSPFKDVPKTHVFYKAILWGAQEGITKGYSDGTDNFKNSRIVDRFINSEIYRNSGSIYFVDNEGRIYSRNSTEFETGDSLPVEQGAGRTAYLSDKAERL